MRMRETLQGNKMIETKQMLKSWSQLPYLLHFIDESYFIVPLKLIVLKALIKRKDAMTFKRYHLFAVSTLFNFVFLWQDNAVNKKLP